MTTILYLGAESGYEAAGETLSGHADLVYVQADPDNVGEALRTATGVLDASMRVQITDAMVDASPKLKIISCATTGSDHIDRKSLDMRGIPVRTLREDAKLLYNLTPAAELTFALMMACARNLTGAVNHTREGQWVREQFPGVMLHGKTLGLVGCGRIGQWMARYANAFGMRVIGFDPQLNQWPDGIEQMDSLVDLAAQADFLSVHVHLSNDTENLISRQILEAAKPGIIIINTSRGGIVEETALLEGLKSGCVAAAGLDVLVGEPNTEDHPLVRYSQEHDNLIITPHCGGFSPDAVRVVCRRAAEKIIKALGK